MTNERPKTLCCSKREAFKTLIESWIYKRNLPLCDRERNQGGPPACEVHDVAMSGPRRRTTGNDSSIRLRSICNLPLEESVPLFLWSRVSGQINSMRTPRSWLFKQKNSPCGQRFYLDCVNCRHNSLIHCFPCSPQAKIANHRLISCHPCHYPSVPATIEVRLHPVFL